MAELEQASLQEELDRRSFHGPAFRRWAIARLGQLSLEQASAADAPEQVETYLEWLDTQMRFFYRNPQVCRTYYECLTRLQSMLQLPITEFEVPKDES